MTHRVPRFVLIFVFAGILVGLSSASTVKTEKGQVVEGEISADVVVVGIPAGIDLGSWALPVYSIVPGESIDVIEAQGVSAGKTKLVLDTGSVFWMIVISRQTAKSPKEIVDVVIRGNKPGQASFHSLDDSTMAVLVPVSPRLSDAEAKQGPDRKGFSQADIIRIARDFYGNDAAIFAEQAFDLGQSVYSQAAARVAARESVRPPLFWTGELLGQLMPSSFERTLEPLIEVTRGGTTTKVPVAEIRVR